MHLRLFRTVGAVSLATGLATFTTVTTAGQSPSGKAAKTSAVPRTPDGRPDLQGNWTNNSVTPLERPKAWAGKTRLNDQEMERLRKLTAEVTEEGGDAQFGDSVIEHALSGTKNPASSDSGTGNYNHFWLVERTVDDRRTSLITDPPDGRLPALTHAARDRQVAAAAERKQRTGSLVSNPEERGLGERCVNFGVPKIGAGYNSYYQIVQTPTHVMFLSEMAHDARIIPVDGRPHLDSRIEIWNGDPRGRWEGDTLVVESTNFSKKSEFRGSRENLKLVERFTRISRGTLNYEITVSDPTVWTAPWTAMIPLSYTDDTIYEYACHEGNYNSMEGVLKGSRTLEKEAAEVIKTTSRP